MGVDEDSDGQPVAVDLMEGAEPDSSDSDIPQFHQLLREILNAFSVGAILRHGEVASSVADQIRLSGPARERRLPTGKPVFENRVQWGLTSLTKAELVELVAEGEMRITAEGVRLRRSEGPIDRACLIKNCPTYAAWHADMGVAVDQVRDDAEPTVWMLRAGPKGVFAPDFVERAAVVVGWAETGDVVGLNREEILARVKERCPEATGRERGQATNTLHRLLEVMSDGDLVLTPEPATRTILLGRISGPYEYLQQPLPNASYRHARAVDWFARVSRNDLSYGARNSLGSLLTLTHPSHESELHRLADAHRDDPRPEPLTQLGRRSEPVEPVTRRVPVPANASVPPRTATGDVQTFSQRMVGLLDQLHQGHVALPDFQRSFVWAPEATRELVVSLIRGFPAGNLLLLQDGSSKFKARAAEQAPELQLQPSFLVLDGQQRLTSLYQALFGVGESRFFLDIGGLISGSEVNEAVRVIPASRAAPLEGRQAQADALMMPLAAALSGQAAAWRDEVVDLRKEGDTDPERLRGLLRDVEQNCIKPLIDYSFPVTVLPGSTELEAVCTIFETLNRTGKPLTPFELISARAFAGGLSLYDLWSAAMNKYPILDDFEIEPYYLLQVVALRLGTSCKRGSVLALSGDDIAEQWDGVLAGMAGAIALLRDQCGVLVPKWLPYKPMLIPLAAAWRQVAAETGPAQGAARGKLARWFWCASFTGEYESSSATLAERDAPVLIDWLRGGDPPPVVTDFAFDAERWRLVTAKQQGLYRATIALTLSHQPLDFHTAAPLTLEVIRAAKVDDHHVFPRAYLKEIGRGAELDSVLNHAVIDRETNLRIGKRPPSSYLSEIEATLGDSTERILASQRLPNGPSSPLTSNDFDAFLTWRVDAFEELLHQAAGRVDPLPRPLAPHLQGLDSRVEQVELAIRHVIHSTLTRAGISLPSHLETSATDRLRAAHRKQPGNPRPPQRELETQLQYLDLRELQDAITSKQMWTLFESRFGSKGTTGDRFNQLAELRNSLRHSRDVTNIVIKDGEAALLWFASVLRPDGSDS